MSAWWKQVHHQGICWVDLPHLGFGVCALEHAQRVTPPRTIGATSRRNDAGRIVGCGVVQSGHATETGKSNAGCARRGCAAGTFCAHAGVARGRGKPGAVNLKITHPPLI